MKKGKAFKKDDEDGPVRFPHDPKQGRIDGWIVPKSSLLKKSEEQKRKEEEEDKKMDPNVPPFTPPVAKKAKTITDKYDIVFDSDSEEDVPKEIVVKKSISYTQMPPKKRTFYSKPKAPAEPLPRLTIQGNPKRVIPYVVPTCRAQLFRQPLPDSNVLLKMRAWAQGGAAWKAWRCQNLTVGASAMAAMLGLSHYDTPLSLMLLLMGKVKKDINETVYTMIGHLFEPLCGALFMRTITRVFLVIGCIMKDIGVLYHRHHPWGTASLDGLLNKGVIQFVMESTFDGKTTTPTVGRPVNKEDFKDEQSASFIANINMDECIIECKVPSRNRYYYPPAEHIVQKMWQIATARSQSDPDLKNKSFAFLTHLYPPFISDKLKNFEGAESFDLEEGAIWTQRIWLMCYHEPLYQWMLVKIAEFKRVYELVVCDPEYADEIIPDADNWMRNGHCEIPEHLMPPIYELQSQTFYFKGKHHVDLRDEKSKQLFMDTACFADTSIEGKYAHFEHYTEFTTTEE